MDHRRIQSPVRRERASHYLLLTLLSFAASVSITRLFLYLTGYPQIGSGELHIAHVLWGGLILFVATIGGILFGSGVLLAGFADQVGNLFLLYLGFGIIGGLGNGFGYVTPIATLIRWFPDKRGLITGLAVMGFGAGARPAKMEEAHSPPRMARFSDPGTRKPKPSMKIPFSSSGASIGRSPCTTGSSASSSRRLAARGRIRLRSKSSLRRAYVRACAEP